MTYPGAGTLIEMTRREIVQYGVVIQFKRRKVFVPMEALKRLAKVNELAAEFYGGLDFDERGWNDALVACGFAEVEPARGLYGTHKLRAWLRKNKEPKR